MTFDLPWIRPGFRIGRIEREEFPSFWMQSGCGCVVFFQKITKIRQNTRVRPNRSKAGVKRREIPGFSLELSMKFEVMTTYSVGQGIEELWAA